MGQHVIAAVPHGFRSSFRDWAGEETDHPREVAETALAHKVRSRVEPARQGSRPEDRSDPMIRHARSGVRWPSRQGYLEGSDPRQRSRPEDRSDPMIRHARSGVRWPSRQGYLEGSDPPRGRGRACETRTAPPPNQALGAGGRSHPRPCCPVRHRRPGGDERNSKRPHGIGESGVCASSGVHCVHRPPTSHARSSTAQVVGTSSEPRPCVPLRLHPIRCRIPEPPRACSQSAAVDRR